MEETVEDYQNIKKSNEKFYILLKRKTGTRQTDVSLPAGTIFRHSEQSPKVDSFGYVVSLEDDSSYVKYEPEWLQLIDRSIAGLFSAIPEGTDRLKLHKDGDLLNEVLNINIGDCVTVSLPGIPVNILTGKLRYKGSYGKSPGIGFGVELYKAYCGRGNCGSFGGLSFKYGDGALVTASNIRKLHSRNACDCDQSNKQEQKYQRFEAIDPYRVKAKDDHIFVRRDFTETPKTKIFLQENYRKTLIRDENKLKKYLRLKIFDTINNVKVLLSEKDYKLLEMTDSVEKSVSTLFDILVSNYEVAEGFHTVFITLNLPEAAAVIEKAMAAGGMNIGENLIIEPKRDKDTRERLEPEGATAVVPSKRMTDQAIEPELFSINEIEAYRDAIMNQREDLNEALTDCSEDFIRYLLSYHILKDKEAELICKRKDRSLIANRLVDMIADKPESSVGIYNILMIMKNKKGAAVLKAVCETFGKELEGATWAEVPFESLKDYKSVFMPRIVPKKKVVDCLQKFRSQFKETGTDKAESQAVIDYDRRFGTKSNLSEERIKGLFDGSAEKETLKTQELKLKPGLKYKYGITDNPLYGYPGGDRFSLGSMVEGTIRGQVMWTGFSDDKENPKPMIGIETDGRSLAGFDGTYCGMQRFECPEGRAVFIEEESCKLLSNPTQSPRKEEFSLGLRTPMTVPTDRAFQSLIQFPIAPKTTHTKEFTLSKKESLSLTSQAEIIETHNQTRPSKIKDETPLATIKHEQKNNLNVGSKVCVKIKGEEMFGVIRWIGEMNHRQMAGLEMECEIPEGHDGTHPTFGCKFQCEPKRGIYTPLDKLSSCQKNDGPKYTSSNTLQSVGDPSVKRQMPVHEGENIVTRSCKSMIEMPSQGQMTSKQLPESQIAPKSQHFLNDITPLTNIPPTPSIKEIPQKVVPTSLDPWKLDTDIMLGSEVEVTLSGQTYQGTVKWIGYTTDRTKPISGLEMKQAIPTGNDGYFGHLRIFLCKPKHGLFTLLNQCNSLLDQKQ